MLQVDGAGVPEWAALRYRCGVNGRVRRAPDAVCSTRSPQASCCSSVSLSTSLSIAGMCTDEELTDSDCYRALMHQLPRRFHGLPAADQAATLAEPPPLTNTRWDAFLAAVVEHVARLHGHPLPAWLDESARFLDPPWVISRNQAIATDSVRYAPWRPDWRPATEAEIAASRARLDALTA